jgi:hypothetical protein
MEPMDIEVHDLCYTLTHGSSVFLHLSQFRPIRNLSKISLPAMSYLSESMNGNGVGKCLEMYVSLLNKKGYTPERLYKRILELPIYFIGDMVERVRRNSREGIYQISLSCNSDIGQKAILDRAGVTQCYQELYANPIFVRPDGKMGIQTLVTPKTKPFIAHLAIQRLKNSGLNPRIGSVCTDGTTDMPLIEYAVRKHHAQILYSPETPNRLRNILKRKFGALPIQVDEREKEIEEEVKKNPIGWFCELLLDHAPKVA